jgi:hypothetical protein
MEAQEIRISKPDLRKVFLGVDVIHWGNTFSPTKDRAHTVEFEKKLQCDGWVIFDSRVETDRTVTKWRRHHDPMRPQVEIGRHSIRRESVPVQMRRDED